MNILSINTYSIPFINYNTGETRVTPPNYGLKMPAQLSCDCVSFGIVTPKNRGSHVNDIPLSTAKQIYYIAV